MKATILFWAVLGVLAIVGVAFLLATRPETRKPGQMSHDELVAFADQVDGRLYRMERQLDSVGSAPGAGERDSAGVQVCREQIVACRALIDSIRREQNRDRLPGLKDRLSVAYGAARGSLGRVGSAPGR